MPDIIHSVFISSTYTDLREERAQVQKSLLKLGCLPIGMELFTASEDDTWEAIKRQIEASDYFVVIIAGRYGTVAPDGRSFTEKEFDYAYEKGIPAIGFVHADLGKIPLERADVDADLRAKLETFRKKVQGPLVGYFTSPHELANEVLLSFINLRSRNPRTGYVRADQAVDPRKYADALEQVAQLKSELDRIRATPTTEFTRASDTIEVTVSLDRQANGQRTSLGSERTLVVLRDGFMAVARHVIAGASLESDLRRAFHNIATKRVRLEKAFAGDVNTVVEEEASFSALRERLFAAGLIQFGDRQIQGVVGMSSVRHWQLTESGRAQFLLLSDLPAYREG
jgi:hypothetical protein